MFYFLILLLIFNKYLLILSDKCDRIEIQKQCLDQENCDSCLQADVCCNWCYDEEYSGRRCKVSSQMSSCDPNKIERNSEGKVSVAKDGNEDFSDIRGEKKTDNIIQIKPQHFNVELRKGIPVNLTFTYKPVKNYPLDLYYLGDLSGSMEVNMKIFKNLGIDLSTNLTKLTKNYKLAYGSFMDKTAMPFYFTDEESFNNPCRTFNRECEKGYLYRHRLNFTNDAQKFATKISSSKITANVDDLDGALDAILQLLVCGKKIGWRKSSRKIILLPTDSLLHMAGDGILVGAVLKAAEVCMLDDEGNHSQPLKYDYPSLEQIEMLLRQKKVNIIFAVKTRSKLNYYKTLSETLFKDYAFVGELEQNSENILDLIETGFYNFAQQVNFYINTTHHDHIDVKFFGDCENTGSFNQTSTCYGVKYNPVNFIVQLTLKENHFFKYEDQLYIEEKNINERVSITLSYVGVCECKNYQNFYESCVHGVSRCGDCYCQEGWTGKTCSTNCDESDFNSCRKLENGTYSKVCSSNGVCECGKCTCDFPFVGKYCESQCPANGNKICSGPTHGKCLNGKCICENGYEGETCSCSSSTDNCFFGGSSACSGNGQCQCNQCNCNVGFTGKYCEKSGKDNNTICEEFDEDVRESLNNKNDSDTSRYSFEKNNRTIFVDRINSQQFHCSDPCVTVTSEENNNCYISFCYYLKDGDIHLHAEKKCFLTAASVSLIAGVAIIIFVVVIGVIGILCIKWRNYRAESIEYKRFMHQRKAATEMNPLYQSPVMEYKNILRSKTD